MIAWAAASMQISRIGSGRFPIQQPSDTATRGARHLDLDHETVRPEPVRRRWRAGLRTQVHEGGDDDDLLAEYRVTPASGIRGQQRLLSTDNHPAGGGEAVELGAVLSN